MLRGSAKAKGLEVKVPLSSGLHEATAATNATILKGDLGDCMATVLAVEDPLDVLKVLRRDVCLRECNIL